MRFLISEKLGPHKYKTPEGYLVCVDAILSRTGTQEYRRCEIFGDACDDPDKIITVDRKADDVFSDKAMASFENKAICIEHPNTNVDVQNHNDLSVGFVRDIHRGEDNDTPVMMGTLVITDKEAVEAIESGEYKELSCGYDCDIDDEHSPQQRNIRGNHVALCKQGRAGIARIVDSNTSIQKCTIADEKLSKSERTLISNYLNMMSTFTNSDTDINTVLRPLNGKGYKPVVRKIDGWRKTVDGMMRKDYTISLENYDNTFLVSLYADPNTYKVTEINAYFLDSTTHKEDFMKDEVLTNMDVHELMKYYTGKNTKSGSDIFLINGKYTINPNVSSKRYNTIAELEAAEEKQHAYMRKGYAPNDPNQFGDSIEDDIAIEDGERHAKMNARYKMRYLPNSVSYKIQEYLEEVNAKLPEKVMISAEGGSLTLFDYGLRTAGKVVGRGTYTNGDLASAKQAIDRLVSIWNRLNDSALRDDSTFVKDDVFENAMKRWGFVGSVDSNYKKGTTYIDLDNYGVYDKARLVAYYTDMKDLERILKRIGAIHDSTHDDIDNAEYQVNAVAYMYGVSRSKAKTMLSSLSKAELKKAWNYYDLKDMPASMRLQIMKERGFMDAAQTQDTFTVEYVKDNITHIVEVEAKTIADAVIKAKTLSK